MTGFSSCRPGPIAVATDLFNGAPEGSRFGVVPTHFPGKTGCVKPGEDKASIQLVEDAYLTGRIIDESESSPQDLRRFDDRSERFSLLERTEREGEALLFGTARLIQRYEGGERLPIEILYPDLLPSLGIEPCHCIELSQLTCCHPEDTARKVGFIALLRVAYSYSLSTLPFSAEERLKLSPSYKAIDRFIRSHAQQPEDAFSPWGSSSRYILAVVEEFLRDTVIGLGIPLADAKNPPIEVQEGREDKTTLYPLVVDINDIKKILKNGDRPLINLFLEGIESHAGLGLFGDNLITSLD